MRWRQTAWNAAVAVHLLCRPCTAPFSRRVFPPPPLLLLPLTRSVRSIAYHSAAVSAPASARRSPRKRKAVGAAPAAPAPEPPAAPAGDAEVEVHAVSCFRDADASADGDTAETEAEREAEVIWAPLRSALERDGSVTMEDGSEMLSLEEAERRVQADEGVDDELDEDEDEDEDEGEDDVEEDEDDDDDSADVSVPLRQPPAPSTPPRPRRPSSSSNTMWIRERGDGSVSVVPWPFAVSGDAVFPEPSSSVARPSAQSEPSAVVGQSIGGEAVTVFDVTVLRERDLREHFTKGGGRGGQKVNKTSNCVHLQHVPTGTVVKCQATRSLAENRRIARAIMQARLEELLLGPASTNQQRKRRIRKSKAKSRSRSRAKYAEQETGSVDAPAQLTGRSEHRVDAVAALIDSPAAVVTVTGPTPPERHTEPAAGARQSASAGQIE